MRFDAGPDAISAFLLREGRRLAQSAYGELKTAHSISKLIAFPISGRAAARDSSVRAASKLNAFPDANTFLFPYNRTGTFYRESITLNSAKPLDAALKGVYARKEF
jgi:hypothetical protein